MSTDPARFTRAARDQRIRVIDATPWASPRRIRRTDPTYQPYRGIAWELARQWRQVVSVLVVGLLFFSSLLILWSAIA